jgi:Domain of unknown function (DUF4281)
MTAPALFSACNMLALLGWLTLAIGVFLKRSFLRDTVSGLWIPVVLSASYAALIVFFFGQAPGGFNSLADVQLLFTAPWAALAGWVHYLAFDLWMGARIARESEASGLPRWPLIILLPLTFLFGPMGYLAFEIMKAFTQGEKA